MDELDQYKEGIDNGIKKKREYRISRAFQGTATPFQTKIPLYPPSLSLPLYI